MRIKTLGSKKRVILEKAIVDKKTDIYWRRRARGTWPHGTANIVRTIPSLSHFFLFKKKGPKKSRREKKNQHLIQELKTPC